MELYLLRNNPVFSWLDKQDVLKSIYISYLAAGCVCVSQERPDKSPTGSHTFLPFGHAGTLQIIPKRWEVSKLSNDELVAF